MAFDGFFANDMALAPPPLMGDFYREPEDVCRGITLDLGGAPGSFDGAWSSDLHDPWVCDAFPKLVDSSFQPGSAHGQGQRFQEIVEPRRVPADPFFFLEKTTHYLSNASPAKAGNRMLDFLEQEIPSSITKVNETKFSIKAEAFFNGHACQIKVKIYQQDLGCAVEFQRRSGDGYAFKEIYEKAVQYLNDNTAKEGFQQLPRSGASNIAKASFVTPAQSSFSSSTPAMSTADHAEAESLTVWLQMAQQSADLRDEVISTIFAMVEEGNQNALECLCQLETLEILVNALGDGQFRTAYPAARLLALAAGRAEAGSYFCAQGLLKSVLSRLWMQAIGKQVWLQIAEIVHAVALGYSAHMTGAQRAEIVGVVTEAIELEPSEGAACVSRRLRDAAFLLGGDCIKERQGIPGTQFAINAN